MNLADSLNFLKKLTARKVWNVAKVLGSYHYSRILKKPVQSGLPFTVSIEPTTSCNLRCPECPSGLRSFTRPTGLMNQNTFQNLLGQLTDDIIWMYFYFQGEPYLNPEFLQMVKDASDEGLYTVTSTNAHYLDDEMARATVESGLDRVIISIDGTTQDTYQSYRIGGKLDKVLEGTKNLVKWKRQLKSSTPHIVFQFLVVRPNEHQVDEVYQLAKEIGVDEVKLKTAQIYDFENGNSLIPENEHYSRYRKQANGTYAIKNKLLNHCWKLWHSCVITWDGTVVPCCFDKDAQYQMGNINGNTFQTIWANEKYDRFREQLFQSRKEIGICKNCTEGTKVWT